MDEFRLPRKIPVGPHSYTIKINRTVDSDQAWARTDLLHKEFQFGELCTGSQLSITFLHELIHAIDECYDTGLNESQITRLANGLADTLQQIKAYPRTMRLKR